MHLPTIHRMVTFGDNADFLLASFSTGDRLIVLVKIGIKEYLNGVMQ